MSYTSKRSQFKSSRVITLGEIDTETTNEVIQLVYDINEEDNKKTQREPIKLIINSGGGDVYSGLAGASAIANCKVPVYTYVEGGVASAGTLLSMVGKKFIEQLTGKLGQSLRKYTEGLGQPDFELEKFAINSLLSATHVSEMDSEDKKDIMKKLGKHRILDKDFLLLNLFSISQE